MDAETRERLKVLRRAVKQDPGAKEFVELAQILAADPKRRFEAREVCFRGLSRDPNNFPGRLLLAKLFYLDQMIEFCIRELLRLQSMVQSESVERLLDAFGGVVDAYREVKGTSSDKIEEKEEVEESEEEPQNVMAEVDLEVDFLDVLNELEDVEE